MKKSAKPMTSGSPGAKVTGGAGVGTEKMPKSFGGGKVKGGGIAGRGKP